MCGLVGLFNKNSNGFSHEQQNVFKTLLLVDHLRGPDSTGAFLVTNSGELSLAKEASNCINFMESKAFDGLLTESWHAGSALIGHNRKATVGTVNDDNAHPFVVDDNIVLVHNGTLFGSHKSIANVEVDSHAIAHLIHEKGDVTAALSSINGAYALIWYDFKKKIVNLIRNNDRPLWWMETKDSWIWSSEKAMLDFVVNRYNLKVLQEPYELPEDMLQTFQLNNKSWDVDSTILSLSKPVKEYSYYNMEDVCAYDEEIIKSETVIPYTTIDEYEKVLAKREKKIITNEQFHKEIVSKYEYGGKVIAEPFDYCFVNQKDATQGYFLYSSICNDPDVIVRQFFASTHMTEDRLIQMSCTDYIYQFIIDTRRWCAYDDSNGKYSTSPGYVVLTTSKATLLHGGGISDSKLYKDNAYAN